jgi:succinate dehydrogenase / fumarate reductase cytochrome b subunit
MWHVFQMHGWSHNAWWLANVAEPYGGAEFHPYNAASSAGLALQNLVVAALYVIGILACVYHLANGIWTMGITWGVWTTPRAQSWALKVCTVFGVLLAIVGLGALGGMRAAGHGKDLEKARQVEDLMYEHRVETGEIAPNEHKRAAKPPETDSTTKQSTN